MIRIEKFWLFLVAFYLLVHGLIDFSLDVGMDTIPRYLHLGSLGLAVMGILVIILRRWGDE
jgi:hypothetical protein